MANNCDNLAYSDVVYRAVSWPIEKPQDSHWFSNWRKPKWHQNGGHHLLPSTNSPSISTCTTSTNLSSLEFQSSSTINKFIRGMNIEENIRTAIPEIEPLQTTKNDCSIKTTKPGLEVIPEDSQKEGENVSYRKMMPQIIAAIAVSWVSMVIGFASGYTSPAETSLKQELKIDDNQMSWISGFLPLMAVAGGLMGGPFIDLLGRKWTLLVTDVLFLIAWTVNYFAQNYLYLYASRIIVGSAIGLASLTLPVYLGETVQPEVRGSLGLLPTAFGNIGILLCYLLGNVMDWRGIAGVGIFLPVPFLLLIWFIPETPRWYISKGRPENAHKALEWLRGKSNEVTIKKEFDNLVKSQTFSDKKSEKLSDLLTRTNIKSLLIVLGLMFFQQMSGINAVIFYTTEIFKDTKSKLDPSLQTTIIGVVNFISTFIATILIDRLGRKALLYVSSVSMIITLALLGTYGYLSLSELDAEKYGWIPLASVVIYVLGFSLGFGPIPWLMMGEILPAKIRGPAASLATGFNWSCTFVVTKTFPLLKVAIGQHFAFWIFCIFMVFGLLFTVLFVPETRGQSLEDIERKLAGVKVRRVSSVANLKPLQSTF